jgi:hypothetical protein
MLLYKYCDQVGALKILSGHSLKVPYITDVNDPFECMPYFYWDNNFERYKKRCEKALDRENRKPPIDFENNSKSYFDGGAAEINFISEGRDELNRFNSESCMLSVSELPNNPVMWAHYAQNHTGAVLAIDFEDFFISKYMKLGIAMKKVKYLLDRPSFDVLIDPSEPRFLKIFEEFPLTKYKSWEYEKEWRTVIIRATLEKFEKENLAYKERFDNKETWFLRLGESAIHKVILGFRSDVSFKQKVKSTLPIWGETHVQLQECVESNRYEFDLRNINLV